GLGVSDLVGFDGFRFARACRLSGTSMTRLIRHGHSAGLICEGNTTQKCPFLPKLPAKTGKSVTDKNYCNNVPFSCSVLDSSGGMTTAAATWSSESRSRSLTPEVERPAERTDLVSMRMILPNWLMTMSSLVSSTRLMAVTLPILGVAFMLM